MPALPLIYPASFSATAALTVNDCNRLDLLTPEQQAELESGHAYIRAINLGPRRRKFEPLPKDFRAKVASYCDAKMTRKMGLPAAVT
jgi:hypothetical protein